MPDPTPRGEFAFIDWLRRRTPAAPARPARPRRRHGRPRLAAPARRAWSRPTCCWKAAASAWPRPARAASAARRWRSTSATSPRWPACRSPPWSASACRGRAAGALAEELYLGLREVADAFDTAIVGGDTNSWDGPLVISVTLLGEATPRGAVRRSGAKPGDWLLVTGPLGGSILGKHLDFTPRVREALAAARRRAAARHDRRQRRPGRRRVAPVRREPLRGRAAGRGDPDQRTRHAAMNDGQSPLEHAPGRRRGLRAGLRRGPGRWRRLLRTATGCRASPCRTLASVLRRDCGWRNGATPAPGGAGVRAYLE